MIDNFEQINSLLYWPDDGSIYHVSIIQRGKDGDASQPTKVIQDLYITSESNFKFMYSGIKALCDTYNARAYINLNSKQPESILYKLIENCIERLKNKQYKVLGILQSCISSSNTQYKKTWVVDVDDVFDPVKLAEICNEIEHCKSNHQNNVIATIPTKNGYHIITHPFNVQELKTNLEIKKNSPTLLYYPL